MSKQLSFRARALDPSKPMPVYMAEELPDLPDFSAINRAVPQMPTGMQKEEECVSSVPCSLNDSSAAMLTKRLAPTSTGDSIYKIHFRSFYTIPPHGNDQISGQNLQNFHLERGSRAVTSRFPNTPSPGCICFG